jgi:hypothetical protein
MARDEAAAWPRLEWQHPFVNVLKEFAVEKFVLAEKHGDVQRLMVRPAPRTRPALRPTSRLVQVKHEEPARGLVRSGASRCVAARRRDWRRRPSP